MKIVSIGDSALIVRLRDNLEQPDQTLALVLQTMEILRKAKLPGVQEITPAFTSVGLYFDPADVSRVSGDESPNEWLSKQITAVLRRRPPKSKLKLTKPIEIPVCYARVFGPDLPLVAEHAGLSEAEVIRRHAAGKFRVQCVGFTGSFPYLSGLPRELTTPRRDIPRKKVPIGSVAIGGPFTGVYAQASPGGWNIIGRTPLRMFDVTRQPAALLQSGDQVRFRSISLEEFNALTTR